MVGRAGVEPTTNGLKVRTKKHFLLLIYVDILNIYQRLTQLFLFLSVDSYSSK